jgi:hypothetical protein
MLRPKKVRALLEGSYQAPRKRKIGGRVRPYVQCIYINIYIYSEIKRKEATNNGELTRAIALTTLNRPLPDKEQRKREIR